MVLVDHLLKTKKEFKNLKKHEVKTIFTELDNACFQHDMAYGNFKYFTRRTASDKILRDKAFKIAKNPKYDGYQRGLASIVYRYFDKRAKGSDVNMQANNESPLDLAEDLHKAIIRKF